MGFGFCLPVVGGVRPAAMTHFAKSNLAGYAPIVLGAAGHIDVPREDEDVLRQSVCAEFRRLSTLYPDSPLIVVTGLAEGSDRLIARCAQQCGLLIAAILPVPERDYETDFSSIESVNEFRLLLAQCVWVTVLSHQSGRPECYRQLGYELANQSQILIGLWDGKPESGIGGTAEVIRVFRQGLPLSKLSLPDAGPVIHVQARRSISHTTHNNLKVGEVKILSALPAGVANQGEDRRWEAVMTAINNFNANVATILRKSPLLHQTTSFVTPDWEVNSGLVASKANLAKLLYLSADTISMKAQSHRDRLFLAMMILGILSIGIFQIYSNLIFSPEFILISLMLSAVGTLLYVISSKANLEGRYLDHRALAEACRVQYYWKLLNIRESVAEFYLRSQRDELEWIRRAVQTTELGVDFGTDIPLLKRLAFVRDAWIEDQLKYFGGDSKRTGKADFNRQEDSRWSRLGQFSFMLGLGLALITAVFHTTCADPSAAENDWLLHCLMLAFSLCFAASGLIKVYKDTKAFAERAKLYDRMFVSLNLSLMKINEAIEAGNEQLGVQVIRELGIEALSESGNWLLMHRERPALVRGIG